MGEVTPRDELPVMPFSSPGTWETWLEANHEVAPGVWLQIAKKASGIPSVTYSEALDVALCYGWIDGQKAGYDDDYFLQRFTPRRARSKWSKINVDRVGELVKAGRMRPAGTTQVEAAKADGRWEAAYAAQSEAEVPADLAAAVAADPAAQAMFDVLTKTNRFALIYRLGAVKRPATRERKIAEFVAMLARQETPHPQKARPTGTSPGP